MSITIGDHLEAPGRLLNYSTFASALAEGLQRNTTGGRPRRTAEDRPNELPKAHSWVGGSFANATVKTVRFNRRVSEGATERIMSVLGSRTGVPHIDRA